ncbi:MAG TPA: ComF family protein [Usitatibacter sp.]|nr:ComF family protein [Usitatibacter sp.]
MSIRSCRQSLQLLKKQAATALRAAATDCLLCGAAGAASPVCGACERRLERIGAACRVCARPLPEPGTCGACLERPPTFGSATAVFAYRFPLDRLVQRFKYAGDLALGRWLGEALADRVASAPAPRPDVLVVPPLGSGRLRERGFNQALELARVVAARLALPVSRGGVVRVQEAAVQAALPRAARWANLRGAFRCQDDFHGLDVAVVDDVLTTGATAEAMARALADAGARDVRIWAVARTPEPGR